LSSSAETPTTSRSPRAAARSITLRWPTWKTSNVPKVMTVRGAGEDAGEGAGEGAEEGAEEGAGEDMGAILARGGASTADAGRA
jgi:hypothetical protein